jgi:hypothetical protein
VSEAAGTAAAPRQPCLLVLPRGFYGFARIVADGLRTLGYEPEIANDEYPENLFGKVSAKLGAPWIRAWTLRRLTRDHLQGRHYALALVIKGRGIGEQAAAALRRHAARVVGYHFDAFRYDPGPARWRHAFERVCTFDPRDAREHGLPLVELFSAMPEQAPKSGRRWRLSAILRNHSQRLAYLDRVLEAVGHENVFVHIYEANRLTQAINFLRQPRLYLKHRRWISRTALPYAEYAAVLADSEFTLDYAHPAQTGITIRCVEALSVGTRIVTNNPSVAESPLFAGAEPVLAAPGSDFTTLKARLVAARSQPAPVRRRGVREFLHELLELPAEPTTTAPVAPAAPAPGSPLSSSSSRSPA